MIKSFSFPYRIVVLPQTIEIMREIQKRCKHVSPLDLNLEDMVQKNEFLLCRWEFENTLLPRDRVEIIHRYPMKSQFGVVSTFEESLILLLAETIEDDGTIVLGTRRGDLRIFPDVCPIDLELREFPMQMSEDAYRSWRKYLSDFYTALKEFQWFKKSKI